MPQLLKWDEDGKRYYELGVDHVVLYPMKDDGTYDTGVAWNGVISIENNPDGADPNDLWADNIKYAVLRSAETLSLTLEAYQFPKEFNACNGAVEVGTNNAGIGVFVRQQARRSFGLCYRTKIGNDTSTETDDHYKIHFVYGCTAQPSSESFETINDNPDAQTMSWDIDTLPVLVEGYSYKPVSEVVIDSRYADSTKLGTLLDIAYGTAQADAAMPSITTIISTLS